MPSRLRRPSPAMIVALIALFVATAGAGVAATVVDGKNLKNRSVSTPKLQIGSVRTAQLATGAVSTSKLRARAVTAGKVATGRHRHGSVSEGKIANGAVSRAKLTADAQLPAVVVRRSAVVDVPGSGAIGTATASCQPGERATGGGVLPVSGPTSLVLAVGDGPVPDGDGNAPAGWQGFVRNGDMGTAQMVAYAICARAG